MSQRALTIVTAVLLAAAATTAAAIPSFVGGTPSGGAQRLRSPASTGR